MVALCSEYLAHSGHFVYKCEVIFRSTTPRAVREGQTYDDTHFTCVGVKSQKSKKAFTIFTRLLALSTLGLTLLNETPTNSLT